MAEIKPTMSEPTMGNVLPVLNVSAEGLPEPGTRPTRTLHRDPLGRFDSKPIPHREPEMVGPPLPAHDVPGVAAYGRAAAWRDNRDCRVATGCPGHCSCSVCRRVIANG